MKMGGGYIGGYLVGGWEGTLRNEYDQDTLCM